MGVVVVAVVVADVVVVDGVNVVVVVGTGFVVVVVGTVVNVVVVVGDVDDVLVVGAVVVLTGKQIGVVVAVVPGATVFAALHELSSRFCRTELSSRKLDA